MQQSLDNQDINILDLMQSDASLTSNEIAAKTNMSQSPCWRRMNRVEKNGIVRKKVALLDRERLGMEVVVFATVNLSAQGDTNLVSFEQHVMQYPEVMECYTMAGSWDYMLKIVTKNIQNYEKFVRSKLTAIPIIREVHSHIAVTEIKNTTELPLGTQL